jgi:hypothetical protein
MMTPELRTLATIPDDLREILTAAGYLNPRRVLWFNPIHPCPECGSLVPIWADSCYQCNGDDPTCPHDSEPTERFTWNAQNGSSYTVCLNCFDYTS